MKNLFTICVCVVCLCGNTQAVEQFNDPTRPAFDLVPGLTSGGSGAADKTEAPAAGLQSVIISPEREAAIINGTEIERGSRYGDAELTVVNETCVVLVGQQGRQVMHMFPAVNMSKDELTCVKRQGMKPIIKAGALKKLKIARKKKTRSHKSQVVCAPEAIKNGSNK